ncbi:MAG: phosphatase PAP2 family protein [Chitinophagales bacterium]
MTALENRKGTQIFDRLLALLPSVDSSLTIFLLTYSILIIFIFTNITKPENFLKAMQAYCLLMIMRTITIYLVPLEPPIGIVILKDPVSNYFMSGHSGSYIVKDLFFSGHVSSAFLFFIYSENKKIKALILALAISVATLILFQHVHYLLDVVAAPFFSYLAYTLVRLANKEVQFPALSKKYHNNNQ